MFSPLVITTVFSELLFIASQAIAGIVAVSIGHSENASSPYFYHVVRNSYTRYFIAFVKCIFTNTHPPLLRLNRSKTLPMLRDLT